MTNPTMKATCVALALALGGCSTLFDKRVEYEVVQPEQYPVLTAVGYAPISAQRGDDEASRNLMALKASKLDAYRELTEQVYGQHIDGEQSLSQMVMADSRLKASVEGVIRGARVVKSYPVGKDTYATELELDFQRVYDLYLSTAQPRRVKEVRYY
ncbi:LPP20 family lipoprotein [Aestuariibacter halophilus]|uniref:LPP20 family lipoprotein n=1 Tax=Fluctibacter halophilus TaxID=226011 RepID=A0ABS8G771_9ALTE|nr:LPP20 family lipoprotein [Aestuariibacter halophilus]MCC2615076.1 LPP20 family lipoprotein [Aestuariibacter halophilus]